MAGRADTAEVRLRLALDELERALRAAMVPGFNGAVEVRCVVIDGMIQETEQTFKKRLDCKALANKVA